MTPAERIAAAMCRAYNNLHAVDLRTVAADDEFEAESLAALEALLGDNDDVHLHRYPDGTVSVSPIRHAASYDPEWSLVPLWVDVVEPS